MKTIIAAIFLVMPVLANAQNNKSIPDDIKSQKAQVGATKQAAVYQTIANELLKDYEGTDKTIAVARFSYSDGRDSRDGGIVAERITTELVKLKEFKIIERKEIEKVFEELKLQRSGAIDSDSVKEIGKMLGADWMVVGTITELPDKELELNTRLVRVESGEILNAINAKIGKDWLDRYRELLEEQNKTIRENVKDAKAFYERGITNTDLAEYDNAIAAFGIAIAISPTYAEAYRGRGLAYHSKGENDKTIEDFSKAIAIDPKNADAYNYRGFIYGIKGEYDKGIADHSKAIEINPKNADAYSARGRKYTLKGEYDKAIEDYSKLIAIDPKDGLAYILRGGVYQKKGEVKKAEADFEKSGSLRALKMDSAYDKEIEKHSKAIEVNPKDAKAYFERGLRYATIGAYDKAIDDFSNAIRYNPQYAESYVYRGKTYELKGNSDKAIEDCTKAIGLKPDYAEAYYCRAVNYGDKGEYEKFEVDHKKYKSLSQK
jgi:tetratricopeptide (TPR) repeat protein